MIEVDSLITPGSTFTASIVLPDNCDSLGGFTLSLEYDFDAVVVDSVASGSLIAGEWEYFTYRTDLLPADDSELIRSAYLKIVALADQHDPDGKSPAPRSRVGAGELARIYLYATDHSSYLNKPIQLRFRWDDCTSNSFSDPTGNQSYLSRTAFDYSNEPVPRSDVIHAGAAAGCFKAIRNIPLRSFDFYSAAFVITTAALEFLQPAGD